METVYEVWRRSGDERSLVQTFQVQTDAAKLARTLQARQRWTDQPARYYVVPVSRVTA